MKTLGGILIIACGICGFFIDHIDSIDTPITILNEFLVAQNPSESFYMDCLNNLEIILEEEKTKSKKLITDLWGKGYSLNTYLANKNYVYIDELISTYCYLDDQNTIKYLTLRFWENYFSNLIEINRSYYIKGIKIFVLFLVISIMNTENVKNVDRNTKAFIKSIKVKSYFNKIMKNPKTQIFIETKKQPEIFKQELKELRDKNERKIKKLKRQINSIQTNNLEKSLFEDKKDLIRIEEHLSRLSIEIKKARSSYMKIYVSEELQQMIKLENLYDDVSTKLSAIIEKIKNYTTEEREKYENLLFNVASISEVVDSLEDKYKNLNKSVSNNEKRNIAKYKNTCTKITKLYLDLDEKLNHILREDATKEKLLMDDDSPSENHEVMEEIEDLKKKYKEIENFVIQQVIINERLEAKQNK